ncbi:alpha/beta fold hydrolase [Pseudonocardia sp. MH-G8]|uniref:alpha/beta fold hydrolase n=1 Tax=Pseudonocardia sp. MH-G8 TaxID=1854588 RepID=UPI001E3CC97F|nr:alpha/beta fold hydrolase [Pseudonocardia sp. MH-G8]
MHIGELTPTAPWDHVRRTARHLARSLGPAVGLTTPALLRHPVWRSSAAEGGGAGVVVVPGFGGLDASMAVLRRWLQRRGYVAVGAALAGNIGCTQHLVTRLERRVEEHATATGGPVVLLGHSRGGMLARVIAARRPDLVRGLAMLGSPVLDPLDARGLARLLLPALVGLSARGVPGLLNGDCLAGVCGDTTADGLAAPLRVPAVAIYSREDGVVGWRSCQDPEAEWVEVTSSHTGMGTDPQLYTALATRLAAWAAR